MTEWLCAAILMTGQILFCEPVMTFRDEASCRAAAASWAAKHSAKPSCTRRAIYRPKDR